MMILRAIVLIAACFLNRRHFANGTFTRVGNTYMKTPDSCCSIVDGETAKECDMTSLHATGRDQLAYSPGFPNRFPIGRMCMWTIQCQFGYQVRLEFRDFYLIGPGKDGHCSDQYVMVESPLTGHTMGRFCGNSGIPTIVSAGNLLVVKLYSEIPQSSENFRGFVFVFKETLESPNQEMRPIDWVNHGQYSLNPRAIAKHLIKLKPTNIPDPNAPTTTVKNRITAKVHPPAKKDDGGSSDNEGSKPNRKPTRPRPPNFARPPGTNIGQNFYGNNQNRDIVVKNDINNDSAMLLPLEVIVAICAGGICGLALLILIVCKVTQVCWRKSQRNKVSTDQPTAETGSIRNTEDSIEMTALSSQKLTQENSYKENTLPLGPQAEETMFSNPHPYPIDYGLPPPMYCANASTLPKSEKSMGTVSTCLSNTLPPGYTPNYGVPFVPSYSVSLPNPTVNTQVTQAPNQKLLLYDPATGLLYDQSQQPQPISLTEKASTIPSQKYNTLHDSDDSDTSSESSFFSDYSRERRRSKNKPVAKKRKANPTKRRRQNKPNRRRRKRKR